MTAKLALENGLVLEAEAFGAEGEVTGEVVFNTSLSGYQEIFTDPSYRGQIVTMTYPLIGNYGVNDEDIESALPQVAGVVVREYSRFKSNFRSSKLLGDWLREHNVIAVEGLDTRMLTRLIRTEGAMRGVLSTIDRDAQSLLAKAGASVSMTGLDLATAVSCDKPYSWSEPDMTPFGLKPRHEIAGANGTLDVIAYDYGIKRNILRRLVGHGCNVTVVPMSFPAEEVLQSNPDGIFFSNGPGDPSAVAVAIQNIKKLIGKKPLFGICLGHQLCWLALGGKTFKLKFGHRGANHPVKNLLTGHIEITAQNHGFAVDPSTLSAEVIEATHLNLNDGTNEGFRHRHLPLFCVQYHPEASPGPHDSDYLFRDFVTMMKTGGPVSPVRL